MPPSPKRRSTEALGFEHLREDLAEQIGLAEGLRTDRDRLVLGARSQRAEQQNPQGADVQDRPHHRNCSSNRRSTQGAPGSARTASTAPARTPPRSPGRPGPVRIAASRVVRDEHDAHRCARGEAPEVIVDTDPRDGIDGAEFVEEERRRLEHHRPAQGGALLLATGQFVRLALRERDRPSVRRARAGLAAPCFLPSFEASEERDVLLALR